MDRQRVRQARAASAISRRYVVVCACLAGASVARADDGSAAGPSKGSEAGPSEGSAAGPSEGSAALVSEGSAAHPERTAADVAHQPLPGDESGRVDGNHDEDSALRDVGQAVLVVPRVAFEAVMAPIRGSVWLYDRYQLKDRFNRIFFDSTYTYGLYPVVNFSSLYGITAGARFVHRNLFGEREHFAMRAAFGGEYREVFDGHLRSGLRLGERTRAELRGQYELRPTDPFYGIGNADDAIEEHHRQRMVRGATSLDVRAIDFVHVRASAALTDLEYSPSTTDPMPIDVAYPTDMLTGWPATRNVYGELELRYDRRARTTTLDQHATFDTGALVAMFAGPVHQLRAGGDYWRYGGDAQYFIPLAAGPRTLAARLHLEAVTGTYDEVAFTQLPQLGGKRYLRGYPTDRFRDRVAALGSLEYQWDLSRPLMAGLFVDAGRVYPSLADVTTDGMRIGFGISLQLHDNLRYLGDVSVASSIDGGVFVNLSFDPVFDIEPRVEAR